MWLKWCEFLRGGGWERGGPRRQGWGRLASPTTTRGGHRRNRFSVLGKGKERSTSSSSFLFSSKATAVQLCLVFGVYVMMSTTTPTMAQVVVSTAPTKVNDNDKKCGIHSECYIYDLVTAQETQLVATPAITRYEHVPSGSTRPAILCVVVNNSNGTAVIQAMEYGLVSYHTETDDEPGVVSEMFHTYTSNQAPYWIDGSLGESVEQWLHSCGNKTLTVRGQNTAGRTCFRTTYQLVQQNCHDDNVNSNDDGDTEDAASPLLMMNYTEEEGDLHMRFSKITRIDDPTSYIEPLRMGDYPFFGDAGAVLGHRLAMETTASSVMLPGDHQLIGIDVHDYVRRVGGPPTMPNADPNHAFWDDFRTVVEAQERRRNDDMSDLNLPQLWRDLQFNVTDVAMAIRNEFPGHWQALLIESMFREGVKLDTTVLPFRSQVDFVGGPVRMAALNTWAIITVSPTNFCMKWMFGRPRPEEVAFAIQQGDIPASAVPQDIKKTLSKWNLTKQEEFTGYKEGAPRHPSWPAMHSAASSASFWMNVVFNLTEEQHCQALLTDWIVSYGRTVAGVHYPTDNLAGLNLGQEILSDTVVDHLVEKYGAHRTTAQAKVDASRFDWADFDPMTCRINVSNSTSPSSFRNTLRER